MLKEKKNLGGRLEPKIFHVPCFVFVIFFILVDSSVFVNICISILQNIGMAKLYYFIILPLLLPKRKRYSCIDDSK